MCCCLPCLFLSIILKTVRVNEILRKSFLCDCTLLGKDFIRPVQSQEVREISNSVMTIKVKFTAQPGAHFDY